MPIRVIRGQSLDLTLRNSAENDPSGRLLHSELSEKIIGAAIRVLNQLQPGLDEKLYENALLIELADQGLSVEQQKSFPVPYKGRFIGKLTPHLIVEHTRTWFLKADPFIEVNFVLIPAKQYDKFKSARPL